MATATLRPDSGISKSPLGTQTLPASPNGGSFSPGPSSGYASPDSPSTAVTSAAPSTLPSNEEVEARIKQATSTAPTSDGRPPPGKDTRTQLFAGNLPYRVRWQDLKDLFRRSGTVLRADVSLTPDNRSRGYGTVMLASAEDAGRAVDMFNGYSWQGRILEVRLDRLGATPGADLDPRAAALVPGLGMMAVNGTGLNANVGGIGPGSVNGLHVPSPHPAIPFPAGTAQNFGASPIPSAAVASPLTTGALSGALSNTSPSNPMTADLIALQQQQQAQMERDREELWMNQMGRGGLDSSFGMLGRGFSVDLEKERLRSNQGMRSLFIGNLPFHCQWQDLKDLFRQAGTILRADVSLGPDGRSRGFGTVSYANEIDAERAVAMFNGFDYNGRTLKVHYDKFSAQSPLPPTLSSDPSTLTTPVQAVSMSTQAAILQAAQLQQIVSNQTYGYYSVSDGDVTDLSWRNNSNSSIANGVLAQAHAQTLGSNLQALHDSLQMHSPTRPMTAPSMGQQGAQTTPSSSETSPSPFSHQLLGTSPSLAERRQKIPPPIGSRPTTSSGTGFTSGVAAERRSSNGALPLSNSISNPFSTTPASPTKSTRPVGQSLPASSASVPTTSSGDDSSVSKRSATTSSVPTLGSSGASGLSSNGASASRSNHSSQSSTATTCASPRSSHPAHPGPISLPPPPPVSSFPPYSPHHHPMSPQGHPMSPSGPVYQGYPSYGPMSPMHSYPLPPHMHTHNMTPHGLPPITPSMPSFSFVPQPSPGVPAGGSSAIPPTPAEGGPPPPDGYSAPGHPGDSAGSQMSMVPMMSPPLHLPHHVFQPFTPGAAMSPGAFYGRPNGSQPHGSYLNPAVGSPVLIHPPYGFTHPGSQPGSPYYQSHYNGGPYGEEPGGYFPPVNPGPPPPRHEGYFPPLSALGSSGLANEILKDGSSMNMDGYRVDDRPVHERNDSGSAPESSENGPGEDTDAERARSSSSGATSWHSNDENAAGAKDAGARGDLSLEVLADDMAAVQLGSRTRSCSSKRGETSYAAAAASDSKRNVQCTESADDVAGHSLAARRSSMSSESTRRPAAPQKTHSDETGTHVRLNAEETTVS